MKTKKLVLNKKTVAHLSAEELIIVKGGTNTTAHCTDTCDYCTIKSCIICIVTEHPEHCGTIQP